MSMMATKMGENSFHLGGENRLLPVIERETGTILFKSAGCLELIHYASRLERTPD